LFFSKEWFGPQFEKDSLWIPFRCYALNAVCRSSDFRRNQYIYGLIFSLIQEYGRMKLNPFATNTVENLLCMAMGEVPGFAPILNDIPGPIMRLQNIYSDDYLLPYAPIIMGPDVLSKNEPQSIYYSLAYPTNIDFAKKLRALSSKITDLWQVSYYLNKYEYTMQTEYLNIADVPLYSLFKQVDFTFYHTDNKDYKNIRHTSELPKDDPYLLLPKYCQGKEFAEKNVFSRGCIRISYRKAKK